MGMDGENGFDRAGAYYYSAILLRYIAPYRVALDDDYSWVACSALLHTATSGTLLSQRRYFFTTGSDRMCSSYTLCFPMYVACRCIVLGREGNWVVVSMGHENGRMGISVDPIEALQHCEHTRLHILQCTVNTKPIILTLPSVGKRVSTRGEVMQLDKILKLSQPGVSPHTLTDPPPQPNYTNLQATHRRRSRRPGISRSVGSKHIWS